MALWASSSLVAKGNGHEEEIDYLETYNLVVKMESVRINLHMSIVLIKK